MGKNILFKVFSHVNVRHHQSIVLSVTQAAGEAPQQLRSFLTVEVRHLVQVRELPGQSELPS